MLRYFDDLTEGQTAQLLGCSVGTVKSQTARALDEAIDGEEAAPEQLIVGVRRRHRRYRARIGGGVAAAVAIVVLAAVVLSGKITGSGSGNQAASGRTQLPNVLSGLPMPAGMNLELLVTTADGAGWYSTATHKTEPIRGLPAIFSGYQFSRVNGGWVASPITYNSPCSINVCAGPPTTYYFIVEGSLTATRIGTGYAGDGIDPGARARTVWPRYLSAYHELAHLVLVHAARQPSRPRARTAVQDASLLPHGTWHWSLRAA